MVSHGLKRVLLVELNGVKAPYQAQPAVFLLAELRVGQTGRCEGEAVVQQVAAACVHVRMQPRQHGLNAGQLRIVQER